MRIFVSVDLEGVAGVSSWKEQDAQEARLLMTGEVNAVVAGAHEAGEALEEVLVVDSHAAGRNLVVEALDERATLVRGSPRRFYMMAGLEKEHALALFVGYHARAGAPGQMDHTYAGSVIAEVRLGGKPAGEIALNAAYAGTLGVPVGLVAGDDVLAAEVREWLPWAKRVETKRALSRYAQASKHPKVVRAELRAAAAGAVRERAGMKPLELGEVAVEVDVLHSAIADQCAWVPSLSRRGVTLSFRAKDMAYGYRMIQTIAALGRAANAAV